MLNGLIFKVIEQKSKKISFEPSTFYLIRDTWDDYGHKLKFKLCHVDKNGNDTFIGDVKILQRVIPSLQPIEIAETPVFEEKFSELRSDCISLGQTEDYYLKLRLLGVATAIAVLEALRDVAWNSNRGAAFEPASVYRNGLMRANSAKRAFHFGRTCVLEGQPREDQSFAYTCELEGAAGPIAANFTFDRENPIPGRIVAIIGRNAVGKTRFLAQLASDLAQTGRISAERLEAQKERFPVGIPLFNRVLAVSYSAFDRFKRPPISEAFNYVYCGIRDSNGRLSQKALAESYAANRNRVRELGRQDQWIRYVIKVLGETSQDFFPELWDDLDTDDEGKVYNRLSSGQAMLCHLVTGMLAWIQPNTVVIFDEPETHLHPNAVANLFAVLTAILKEHDSLAIVATHSPIVIQEIPSAHVIQFRREGNETVAETLGMESFGESITELTRHVFETIEIDNAYKRVLKNLAEREELSQILEHFPDGLSLNAKSFLAAQYAKRRS